MAPPYLRTFLDYAPPARADGIPFTNALIFESDEDEGPFALLTTINLADLPGGLDANPRNPALRDITASNAQLPAPSWYRIDWRDATSATFEGVPFLYEAPAPLFISTSDVRLESQANFAAGGYPAVDTGDPDPLERRVRAAQQYIERMTGRILDDTLPPELVELAREAVVMRVEQEIGQRSRKAVAENAQSGGLGLKSMRAGDYSETRFDPGDARKARMVNPWAPLAELILLIATPARRAELLADLSDDPLPVGLTMPAAHGFDICGPYGYWP